MTDPVPETTDLFIIGGGINGTGIARDAAGRGMSVRLAEMNDLASATSSASTKLFHGGLRYLEYFEINLVRHALAERETLLRAMPHISWPMRFVLPYHKDMRFEGDTPTSKILNIFMPWMKGRRPAWLIRLGLFLYDHLGGRKILPKTTTLNLRGTPEGAPIEERFEKAYEYSDCWIEDSRLVVLNARDAAERGAEILVKTKVQSAARLDGLWQITLEDRDTGVQRIVGARMLVNAAGPWVGDVIQRKVRINSTEGVRLVRGSHIVTKRLYDHDKCYFFQGTDGRIIFAIPYETDFTLIGTTDAEHDDPGNRPVCTPEERDYLVAFANEYFRQDITADDVVWTYSGVRPLYDDGAKVGDGGDAGLCPQGGRRRRRADPERVRRQDHHLPASGRGRDGQDRAVLRRHERALDGGRPPARRRFSRRRGARPDRGAEAGVSVPDPFLGQTSGARLWHRGGGGAGRCKGRGGPRRRIRRHPDRTRGGLADGARIRPTGRGRGLAPQQAWPAADARRGRGVG